MKDASWRGQRILAQAGSVCCACDWTRTHAGHNQARQAHLAPGGLAGDEDQTPCGHPDAFDHAQPTAADKALQIAFMIVGLARPTRRTRRARATSCTLSRLATDSMRTPSAAPRRTSVDRPRIVDVTGALITDWSNRPIGSRLRTTTGRTLSSRASHSSPRRGALLVSFDLGIEGLPVGLIRQTARICQ